MRPSEHLYIGHEDGKRFFGPGPYELLKGVEREGSLSGAAQSMGMSYSKATRLLHEAECGVGAPLTERMVGGEGGGGSRLSELGRDLLRRYEAWQSFSRHESKRAFSSCFAGFGGIARLGCVVMASGEARRFGSQKLLAPLGGIPVLQRTVQALPLDLLDVVVVTRSDEVQMLCERIGVSYVQHDGPLQSDTLRRGLEVMTDRAACMFVHGDQPLLQRQSVRNLAMASCLNPGKVVRLAWHGEQKSPVVFPASEFEGLRAIEGDVGGSDLLRIRSSLRSCVIAVEAGRPWELDDIDTPEDLARLEGIVSQEGL